MDPRRAGRLYPGKWLGVPMTTYFRLLDEVTIPKRWHLGLATLSDGTEPCFVTGTHFKSSEAPRIPITHPGRALDFSLTSFAVPVVTSKLADAVEASAWSDVECIPAQVGGQLAMVVLNSVRLLRCLDERRSEFIKWTANDHRSDLAGQYRQITRLVLAATKVPSDARFFRIEGSFVELVVADDVRRAMESAGCFGARFIELPTES